MLSTESLSRSGAFTSPTTTGLPTNVSSISFLYSTPTSSTSEHATPPRAALYTLLKPWGTRQVLQGR
jgi:hypothetical protein